MVEKIKRLIWWPTINLKIIFTISSGGGGGELVPLGLSFMLNFSLRLLKMYWMRPISSIVVSKMMRLSLLVHYFSKKKCNIS